MRVVGCVPVPKARPGSRRKNRAAAAGGSCQVGTIQKLGVISTGSNCDCVRRTQSWSGTGLMPTTSLPSKKSCNASKRAASSAWGRVANKATTVDRSQPALGAGMPGSPNMACSSGVWASASSTDTLSASNDSSASLTSSTPSSGTRNTSSNMGAFVQRWRWASHSSR